MFNSGIRGKRAKDGEGVTSPQSKYVQTTSPQPSISSYSVSGLDDLALDPAGGQTIIVTGTGFASGASATLGGTQIGAVSFISPTKISFTSPAKSAGTYSLVVYNSTGGAAILVPGISYSGVPAFTTAAGSIGSVYETNAINKSIVATSDSTLTYSLASGSLPTGATMSSSGVITGTAPVESGSTTYTFSVTATDAELQDVTRTFTLTINTDVVSWVTPSSGATITLDGALYSQALSATDAAGYSISYSANALPTGLTLSSGTISGTPTVDGNVTTALTATAATTNRSSTNTITWVVSLTDTYWKYVTLLLSADNTTQQPSFAADNSINNAQLTVAGDAKVTRFHPFQYGYYSVYFGANGQYLTGSHASFNVSSVSTAWTFECWVYPITAGCIFAIGSGGAYGNSIYIDWGGTTANKFNISQGNGSSAPVNFGTTNTYTGNKWYHIAFTRTAAGVNTIYVNGVADGTVTYTAGGFATGTTFVLNGSYDNNGLGANGSIKNISNLRFTPNSVLYSSNFTPSTSPLPVVQNTLLLMCQSNRFNDVSRWGHAVTVGSTPSVSSAHPFNAAYQITAPTSSYSYYFNGSSYLTIASTPLMQLGATWTVECWIYPQSTAKQMIVTLGSTTCYIESVSGFNMSKWTSTNNSGNYGGNLVVNSWNHLVWQCDVDGSIRGFINGTVALVSGYTANTQDNIYIGSGAGTNSYTGYISNLRILKGTALYATAGFNPPTAPLTAITNTLLLTCQNSTLVDNSTNAFTLTQTGTVTPTQFYPALYSSVTNNLISTTYGSGYFDGTGDYLTAPVTVVSNLSGDWTVEAWCYMTVAPTGNTYNTSFPILTSEDNAGSIYHYWGVGSTAFVMMSRDGVTQYDTVTGTMPGINKWFHVAVTNVGTLVKVFIDGFQVGSLTQTAATWNSSGVLARIGALYTYRYATGYICGLKVVNGTALYTTSFVPSFNTPSTNTSSTQLLTLQNISSHNNSAFKDESMFNNLITRGGNATNGTFSPYGDNWSNYFDGNGDYITMPYVSDIGNVVLASTSCVEMWIYPTVFTQTASGWPYLVCNGSYNADDAGWVFGTINGGYVAIKYGTSSKYTKTSTGTVPLNQWSHIAVTISGGAITFYINGVQSGSSAIDYNGGTYFVNAAVPITIGAHQNIYYTGYISNLRISYGSAIYTGAFTPSTFSLQPSVYTRLLTAQNNRLIDNSYYTYTLTKVGDTAATKFSPFKSVIVPKYYSTYFNGSTDYLSTPASSNFNFGTNNFTIECWIWLPGVNSPTRGDSNKTATLFDFGNSGASQQQCFSIAGSTSVTGTGFETYFPTNGFNYTSPAVSISYQTWHHVAFVRNGNTLTAYLDGVGYAWTQSVSGLSFGSASNTVKIGGSWLSTYLNQFYGYITNVRVVNGTAVYTSNFTPSASPLTTITNTVLLTCQNNTFIDNSTNNFTITAGSTTVKPLTLSPFTSTPNAAQTTYSPATFGGSVYFDGSGDYLYSPTNGSFILGTADFTIEFWLYPVTVGTNVPLFDTRAVTGSTTGLLIRNGDNSAATNVIYAIVAGTNVTQTTIYTNQWHHVAVTRASGSVKVFVNGMPGTAVTASTNVSDGLLNVAKFNDGAVLFYNGYMSDVRVTKGVSLYNSAFYPGTSPLTSIVNVGTSIYPSSLMLTGTSSGVVDQSRTVDLETVGDARVVQFSPYSGTYYGVNLSASTSNISFTQPALGTTFTLEMWVYPTTAGSNSYYYAGSTTGPLIGYNGATFSVAHQGGWSVAASTNPTLGVWNHIALVREGTGSNQCKLYLNGSLVGTGTEATTFASQSATIGATSSGTQISYISNVRLTINQALYTGSFTPSTTPLTATAVGSTGAGSASSITGTVSLLTAQSNKFVDNSASPLTLTATSSAIVTQNPFQINTGLSYYFDGTGDYLVTWNIVPYVFGTNDFTMEAWVYRSDTGTQRAIIDTRGSASVGILFYVTTDNKLNLFDSTSTYLTSTNALPAYVWTHVAVTRSSGTTKLFVNGVVDATLANDTRNYTTNSAGGVLVGRQYGSTTNDWYGYISDLRITKGFARYTSTFTPPTAPVKLL